jgi:Na+/H+ antiporter NhaD/arsenite permease-like protein
MGEGVRGWRERALVVLAGSLATALSASLAGLELVKVVALTVFLTMIYATLLLWSYRLSFALLGLFALLSLGVVDVRTVVEHAHLDVILFLVAMMILVGYLEEKGFFDFVAWRIIGYVRVSFKALFLVVVLLSAFLAALIDEVTSILIITSLVLRISDILGVSPFPMILASIFATNIGSSMTVVGNPVGVLLAFSAGLTFTEFLRWATPTSLMAVLLTAGILLRQFRGYIEEGQGALLRSLERWGEVEVRPPREIARDGLLFASVILALTLHHPLEEALGLGKNSLLLAVPMLASGLILLLDPERGFKAFEHRVEWGTLVFFLLLFASVGTLEYVGLVADMSRALASMAGSSLESILLVLTPLATLMSASLDNVLAVAILVPVVHELGAVGLNTYPLWWAILFTACYAANLTPVGSTANIVAAGMLERRGLRVSVSEWLRRSIPTTVASLALALLLVYLQAPLMP